MEIIQNSILNPPSDERIIKIENYSHVKFPTAFIEFIKKSNGGIPVTNKFILSQNECVVERFLCILDNPKESELGDYDISVVLTQLDERLTDNGELIGDELIPFGALFGGDFVCLDYTVSQEPTICIWYHEESEELAPVIEKIADNINEFFEMLSE
ncbi:cell wall assembly protein [Paenibacillus glacialis]|uniref:Cell wall assembly protein n=2 Tax=Paenibacillus glacialis TaxID=494026 RepID=A0A168N8A8_9BACL|nr:SMI1/KNR4 family protein [Paenibacillus glacialis]OAB45512.1 cell wall assembly protein [Paenibacillus glacialis]